MRGLKTPPRYVFPWFDSRFRDPPLRSTEPRSWGDNRLPPCPVKTLSLGLRCGTKRQASTSSGPAGTTRNWPTFPLRTVTDGWAPAPTWSSTPPHAAELDTPPRGAQRPLRQECATLRDLLAPLVVQSRSFRTS